MLDDTINSGVRHDVDTKADREEKVTSLILGTSMFVVWGLYVAALVYLGIFLYQRFF